MSDTSFKDFIGGTAGGVAQVLSGQPFDIIKVRQVTSTTRVSIPTAILSIIRDEGVFAF